MEYRQKKSHSYIICSHWRSLSIPRLGKMCIGAFEIIPFWKYLECISLTKIAGDLGIPFPTYVTHLWKMHQLWCWWACATRMGVEKAVSSTKGDLARWLTPFRGSFFNAWWQRQIKDLHHSLFWPWDKDRVSLADKRVTHFFSTQAKLTEGENWSPERSAKPRIHCAKLVPPVWLSTCNFTELNSMFYVGEKGVTLAIRTSG